MSGLLVMARSVAREPGGAGGADWLRGGGTPPNSKMDRFAPNDNTLSFEHIIAVYATVWTVLIALRPLWKWPSAAVSPRPPAASLARRPPLRARLENSKRGSACDFSTAPHARSASPRPASAFWRA